MIFRETNIRIEFSEEEIKAVKKVQSIFDLLAKKINEDKWKRSLGVDGAVYYDWDEVNCAKGVLDVLTDDKVEIIVGLRRKKIND